MNDIVTTLASVAALLAAGGQLLREIRHWTQRTLEGGDDRRTQ